MILLGNFANGLQQLLYKQLLLQLDDAISKGEYSAGTLFDTKAAQAIQVLGQSFSSLTLPTAGSTAMADDINKPLDLLQSRYSAIINEITNLEIDVIELLALIDKESSLIDQIIAAAEVEAWVSQQQQLTDSNSFSWSFSSGHGITSTTYPGGRYQVDPLTNSTYTVPIPKVSYVYNYDLSNTHGLITVVNPGFESGSTGWVLGDGGAISFITSSQFHSGSHSLAQDGHTSGGSYQNISGLIPGNKYKVSVWVKFVADGVLPLSKTKLIVHDTIGGSLVSTDLLALAPDTIVAGNPGTDWSQLSIIFTAGSNGLMRIYLYFGAGGGTIFYDDITVEIIDPRVGIITEGLGSAANITQVSVKNLVWEFTTNSDQTQFEEIYGDDSTWAYLATLEPDPILLFGPPNVSVILPIGGTANNIFTASGFVPGGGIPVYVRVLFNPRQTILPISNGINGQIIRLSIYNVVTNTVDVYNDSQVFVLGTDYTIDSTGIITILNAGLVGVDFNILFTEYYPAYQSSIDQTNWSPIVMFDPTRPYPDGTSIFIPVNIQNGNYPLMDELGNPLGIFIQKVSDPNGEMVLLVQAPGASGSGESATLTINLEKAVYINGLQLSPVTNFPVTITSISAVGFTDTMQSSVLDIPIVLDRSTIIRFPRQLVRSFIIKLYQTNYSLKEYIVSPPDSLRRNTLANLQSYLPFSVQRPNPSTPQVIEGCLYELGLEDIVALDIEANFPGVFVSGPFRVQGQPEIIRLVIDGMLLDSSVDFYLAYIAYNANDQEVDQNELPASICISYPSIVSADHVDFYLKFVQRNELNIIKRFLIQVSTVS